MQTADGGLPAAAAPGGTEQRAVDSLGAPAGARAAECPGMAASSALGARWQAPGRPPAGWRAAPACGDADGRSGAAPGPPPRARPAAAAAHPCRRCPLLCAGHRGPKCRTTRSPASGSTGRSGRTRLSPGSTSPRARSAGARVSAACAARQPRPSWLPQLLPVLHGDACGSRRMLAEARWMAWSGSELAGAPGAWDGENGGMARWRRRVAAARSTQHALAGRSCCSSSSRGACSAWRAAGALQRRSLLGGGRRRRRCSCCRALLTPARTPPALPPCPAARAAKAERVAPRPVAGLLRPVVSGQVRQAAAGRSSSAGSRRRGGQPRAGPALLAARRRRPAARHPPTLPLTLCRCPLPAAF